MCNCGAEKATGFLVPKLQSEVGSGHCYGKFLMSPYTIVLRKFTRVLVKKQLGIRQDSWGKTAVIKAEAYIRQKDNRIQTGSW